MTRHLVSSLALSLLLAAASVCTGVRAEPIATGTDNAAAFKGARRIAIDQFGIEFITTLQPRGSGGGNSSSITATLEGPDDAAMQRIADAAYRDTVAQLVAAGFEVISMEELLAQPEYQELAAKSGHASPWLLDDSGNVSRTFAPTGMKAYFQTSGGRGNLADRMDALNGGNGAKSSALAKRMNAHFVRFHFLASFGTAAASGGFLANMTKKARASIEVGPQLVAKETQAQIISQEGQRIFMTTSRSGVNGSVYLDRPVLGAPEGFELVDTTSADAKQSDNVANAVSVGLSLLTGGSARSTRNTSAAVRVAEPVFVESYTKIIAAARDGLVDQLKNAAR